MFLFLFCFFGSFKGTESVKQLHILTANTKNRVWSVMWVSKSFCSAVNQKYISGILSPDWTRVGAGYQNMSSLYMAERRTHVTDRALDISDVCLSVELFNTY